MNSRSNALPAAVVLFALALLTPTAAADPATRPGGAAAADADAWWWPELPAPRRVIRTTPIGSFADAPPPGEEALPPRQSPAHMLVQSAAGLAARALRRGEGDELVWVDGGDLHDRWYALARGRLGFEEAGPMDPWQLVAHLRARGHVDGYVLYRYDRSDRGNHRDGAWDDSVNVATAMAGPLRAVIVDETLRDEADAAGLPMLLDARGKTSAWVFENHRGELSRETLMLQDPKVAHNRDYAVAHDLFVAYGRDEPVPAALAWLEPLSPILGWNIGAAGEGANTQQLSRFGHFNTATDWALNLPVLSAGARDAQITPLPRPVEAEAGGPDADRPPVALVMSDGDNVQWMVNNFFASPERAFWDSPDHGRFPITWTLPLAHLRQVAPDLLNHASATISPAASAVEFGGGYYFPDEFAAERPGRRAALLAEHARNTWHHMDAAGATVLCLILRDLDSPEALEAYQILADNMPGLEGILVMQYWMYHSGEGEIFRVARADGTDVPIVSCAMELRTDFSRPKVGGVAKIAGLLADADRPQWVVVHAWSDHDGEDGADGAGPIGRGTAPTARLADRVAGDVRLVNAHDLIRAVRDIRPPGP